MDSHPMEMDPRRKVADDIKEIFESAIKLGFACSFGALVMPGIPMPPWN